MQKSTHHPVSADATECLTVCLECGSESLEKRNDVETFEYGGREKPFTVTAPIPSLLCTACGFRFYDDAAEWARHKAACRHLGVMTPDEIRALRKRYDLTQEALAELTGLGVASLGRWERGAGIQNEACDALLYLLAFTENVERLRGRHGAEQDPKLGIDIKLGKGAKCVNFVTCVSCGMTTPESTFCPLCGKARKKWCPRCGEQEENGWKASHIPSREADEGVVLADSQDEAKFCPDCGTELQIKRAAHE